MKKVIVPLFLSSLIVLGITSMYVRGASYLAKYPTYEDYPIIRNLSIPEVQQTNVGVQTDVDYSVLYKIRTYTSSKNLVIRYQLDTAGVLLIAKNKSDNGLKPYLPKDFSWGTLKL